MERDSRKKGRSFPLGEVGKYVALAFLAASAGMLTALLLLGEEPAHKAPGRVTAAQFIRHAEPQSVPDIVFADPDGRTRHLSEWRGKVVLLNLWATWCAPCKSEMPSLDRLQAELGGDSFTVLALSTDRTGPKEPAAFFAREGIAHLKPFNDDTAEANIGLKAPGLPLTVVLNKDGKEVARLVGPADWDSPATIAEVEGFLSNGG